MVADSVVLATWIIVVLTALLVGLTFVLVIEPRRRAQREEQARTRQQQRPAAVLLQRQIPVVTTMITAQLDANADGPRLRMKVSGRLRSLRERWLEQEETFPNGPVREGFDRLNVDEWLRYLGQEPFPDSDDVLNEKVRALDGELHRLEQELGDL
jgi:hypothetical protein